MSDSWDRDVIPFDEKLRVLDLTSYKFEPPDVGIYDGQVRYYKANLEWAKIIEGHISWLATIAAWPDADDENYQAINEILIFLRGVEVATVEEICEAIECGFERVAVRFLSGDSIGTGDGFTLNPDGTITDGTAVLPEDDPATLLHEGKAAAMGGAIAVGIAINEMITAIDTYYGATNGTPVTALAEAQYYMNTLYPTPNDANMDTAVANYYTHRTATSKIVSLGTASFFYNFIYCDGYTANDIATWVLSLGLTYDRKKVILDLFNAIGSEFWDERYQYGLGVPSSDYVTAPCEPVETETITFDFSLANDYSRNTNQVHKAGHRIRFDISGSFVDSDVVGTVRDMFYMHTLATDVKTFESGNFNFIHSASNLNPAQAKVPYAIDHIYSITLDIPKTNSSAVFRVERENASYTLPNVSGIITIVITDLGEYS